MSKCLWELIKKSSLGHLTHRELTTSTCLLLLRFGQLGTQSGISRCGTQTVTDLTQNNLATIFLGELKAMCFPPSCVTFLQSFAWKHLCCFGSVSDLRSFANCAWCGPCRCAIVKALPLVDCEWMRDTRHCVSALLAAPLAARMRHAVEQSMIQCC